MSGIQQDDDLVFRKICSLIEPLNEKGVALSRETDLIADLEIDSVAVLDMVMDIEDFYDISIPVNTISETKTIGELVDGSRVDRIGVGDQPIQHDAQRVEIALRARRLAAHPLGRHVTRRAHHLVCTGQCMLRRRPPEKFGEPEVRDLHAPTRVDEDILRSAAVDRECGIARRAGAANRAANLRCTAVRTR